MFDDGRPKFHKYRRYVAANSLLLVGRFSRQLREREILLVYSAFKLY